MYLEDYVKYHADILPGKRVLDLACADGRSTQLFLDHGVASVDAVEINQHWVNTARKNLNNRARVFQGNITDGSLMVDLVAKTDIVSCFGAFYHLHDHFRLFELIMRPNVQHVIIETLFGPESGNPQMFWGYEEIDWVDHKKKIPHGAPNISWIVHSARIFGFECDFFKPFVSDSVDIDRRNITYQDYINVAGPDWPSFQDVTGDLALPDWLEQEIKMHLNTSLPAQRRMLIRLYNSQCLKSVPIDLEQVIMWPYS